MLKDDVVGIRTVILSTNMAESGITLNDIVFVIDSGLCKQQFFDYELGCDVLNLIPTSKASAQQRAGRTGRVRRGWVFRLYTEITYDKVIKED